MPARQRRLDTEIAPNHLLTSLIEGIPCPASQRLNNVVVVAAGAELGSDAKQGREPRGLEPLEPVVVDLIFKASISGGVGARPALKHDRTSVRHHETGPNQKHAGLPERDLAIIDPDQSSVLPVDGLSGRMRDAISEAGPSLDCKPHGLRKTVGRLLAESGATAKKIISILGHTMLAEAERYTEEASLKTR